MLGVLLGEMFLFVEMLLTQNNSYDSNFSGFLSVFFEAILIYALINGLNLYITIPNTARASKFYGVFLVVISLISFLFLGINSI